MDLARRRLLQLAAALAAAPTRWATARADVLERTAVLGASASAGFNLGTELGHPLTLADLLRRAAGIDAGGLLDLADAAAFRDADRALDATLGIARGFEPTAVIGADLTFWYVHGEQRRRTPLARIERLLRGLGPLADEVARRDGRLALGTIPRVDERVDPIMMPRAVRAPDSVVARANERLVEWTAERPEVLLLPVAETFDLLREGELPSTRGIRIDADDADDPLQDDGLHPTAFGLAVMALGVLEALDCATGGSIAGRVLWDVEALLELVV